MDILENMRNTHKNFSIRLLFDANTVTLMRPGGPTFGLDEMGQLVMLRPNHCTELSVKCNAIGIDCYLAMNADARTISRICLLNRPCSSRCGIMITSKDGQMQVRGFDNWTRDADAYAIVARKPL